MNLLMLTPQLPHPPRQGTTIRNFNLIKQLAARHTIDLISFLAPGDYLDGDNPLLDLCRRVHTVPQPVRTLHRRGFDTLTTRLPDMALRLNSPAMNEVVAEYVRNHQYDIVQNEGIETSQYAYLARAAAAHHGRELRWVFDNHNCEYLLQKRNALTDVRMPRRWIAAGYSMVQWQKLVRYEATVCRKADATVAVSVADAAALRELTPGLDVTVVSNGIDLAGYIVAPDRRPPAPILVFTGKMDYRPNVDAVLWFAQEVLPLVATARPDVRFQIVGMNPHDRLDVLRDHPNVEITGAVTDTRPYIRHAGAYVIPMRIGGGTRFKALEAMATGKPTISTSLGVEGIPVRDGRDLLLADTPADFAAAVLRVLQDDDAAAALRVALGENARAFVEEHYGWSRIVPTLDALYARLLAPAPQPA